MAVSYAPYLFQGLQAGRARREEEEERKRLERPNIGGALAGLFAGATQTGGELISPEAGLGAVSGYLQPASSDDPLRNILAGGLAGYKTAAGYGAGVRGIEAEQQKLVGERGKRLTDLLGKFDIVPEGTRDATEISSYYPDLFTEKTYVKRKPSDLLSAMYDPETRLLMGLPPIQEGQAPVQIPENVLKDLGDPSQYMDGTQAESFGNVYQVVNGQWQPVR